MNPGNESKHGGSGDQYSPVAGNVYDKYGSSNPIVRLIMEGYFRAFDRMVGDVNPGTVIEIGCGEGVIGARVRNLFPQASYSGYDLSPEIVEEARRRYAGVDFGVRSIYDLEGVRLGSDLVIAVEVLEHLEKPAEGLASLLQLRSRYLLLSVPREPVWRILNVLRGKYLAAAGNTPGHLNHWSKGGILAFLRERAPGAEIVMVANPFPWTMILCRRTSS